LIKDLEGRLFDLVNSLQLSDDELAIHHEMNLCESELLYCLKSQHSSDIFCLIVSHFSEKKFARLDDFFAISDHKSASTWTWISSGTAIGMNCVHKKGFNRII
jgi:hypothetical protein